MAKRKEISEMEKVHLEITYDALIHEQLTDLLKSDKDITLTIKMHGSLVQMSSDEADSHSKNALICSLALAATLDAIVEDFRSEGTVTESDVAGWRELTNAAYIRELVRILESDAEADGANSMYIRYKREEDDHDAAE